MSTKIKKELKKNIFFFDKKTKKLYNQPILLRK